MAESAIDLYNFARQGQLDKTASSRSGRIASTLSAMLAGGLQGRQDARAERSAGLADQSRIVEMRSKLQEMRAAAENQRIARNFAKRAGLIDLEGGERDAVRGAALDHLAEKNPPDDSTSAGRIASLMVGGDEYSPVPSWSQKGGLTIDYRRKKDDKDRATENEAAEIRKKAYELAQDAARRDKYSQIQSLVTDPAEAMKFADVQPTQDEIEKYIPESLAYLKGDNEGATKARRSRGSHDKIVGDALRDIQGRINKVRGMGPIDKLTTEGDQGEELTGLLDRRSRLLKGGGVTDLRQQYAEELSRINAKKSKTEADRARMKELGIRLIQIGDLGG